LVSDTSAALIHASPEDVKGTIETALGHFRTFFGAGRCALLIVSADRQIVNVFAASYASGIPQVSGDVNLAGLFPWATHKLVVEGVPTETRSLADLPPEAAIDRASWEALQTKSSLMVPIFTGPSVTHLIVMASVTEEREWPIEYVPRLRLLGEMMVAAVQRQQAFDALRASEAYLREQTTRLAAAVDAAELGFTVWAVGHGPIFLDARTRDLLGIGPEDELRAHDVWLSRIADSDRDQLAEISRQLTAGEIDRAAAEYRYAHPHRGWIWLRHTARGSRDDSAPGRGLTLVSAVQDITDRRSREEALKGANEELKRLRDRLERENVYLRKEAGHHAGGDLVAGRSPAIRHVLELAAQVAPSASTVLLTGETGTGKERFAAYIHQASPRQGRHMVRVNCSAIPSALIESELFGREKGAYTGALTRQAGRFELAHGSTLFLDEIGDLPLDVQVKLLRVLEERTIERLGSPTPIGVDVRIIAATNRDLEAGVREGTFRSDLYYRLNVFPIEVPPLRERPEDIPELVETLIEELGGVVRKRFTSIERASLEALARYDWPGNVRELRNVLERAMILASVPTLRVAPPHSTSAKAGRTRAASNDLHDLEREHILRVLEQTGWRIRGKNAAADALGLKPTTLEARMAKLGIHRPGTHTQS
jgi:transcriptional regulator with GAF, ATPase, and Fis domain